MDIAHSSTRVQVRQGVIKLLTLHFFHRYMLSICDGLDSSEQAGEISNISDHGFCNVTIKKIRSRPVFPFIDILIWAS